MAKCHKTLLITKVLLNATKVTKKIEIHNDKDRKIRHILPKLGRWLEQSPE